MDKTLITKASFPALFGQVLKLKKILIKKWYELLVVNLLHFSAFDTKRVLTIITRSVDLK